MDKLKMRSENLVDENIEKLAKLFPNCITEAKDENGNLSKMVDFDILKQELSKEIVESDKERYQMTWPGKKQSILTANTPVAMTLRPCKDKSVDFNNAKNIYVEGDNLDVLKVLRETYLGKIKMIYIDPPYNTGNDFVYNDDFATNTDDYLERSNQIDDQGNRMAVNSESNGRFHSDWLNMIYPRLKIAKDLLTDDGAIFISIDDNEISNLIKICNEIFGEHNFISNMIWKSKSGGANDVSAIATDSENILVYAKEVSLFKTNLDKDAEVTTSYNLVDENGKRYALDRLDKQSLGYHESLDFPIIGPDGQEYRVQHKNPQNKVARWRWSEETVKERYDELVFKYPYVYTKNYEKEGVIPRNLLIDERFGRSRTGKTEVADLFNKVSYFSFPKPSKLIKYLLNISTNKNDLIMDFFSGSATTAHAVMQLNAEDGGNRKFIMVQLPEKIEEKSETYKAGFKNICDIGEERIRKAGAKLVEEIRKSTRVYGKDKKPLENNEFDKSALQMAVDKLDINDLSGSAIKDFEKLADKEIPDIGFRVFKLDSSNMKDTYYEPNQYSTNLLDQLDENIKPDRTPEDLLFQVLLDLGLMLDSKIEIKMINGKKVFVVGEYNEAVDPDLICCFDSDVDNNTVTEIAKLKPRYCVFRDSSMAKDSVATNFDQIFETYSPSTTRKVL